MLEKAINRTSVIWSFDYSVLDETRIREIIGSEVDALRLVGSNENPNELFKCARSLRQALDLESKSIPLIIDTVQKARGFVCNLSEPKTLALDSEITFVQEGGKGTCEIKSASWPDLFVVDLPVYIGSGDVVLMPIAVSKAEIKLRVIQGGVLENNMEIHSPLTRKPIAIADINQEIFEHCSELSIDYLILPGIENPETLSELKKILRQRYKNFPWLILKVDSEKIFKALSDLLPFVQGVMISRIELAMCMDPARIPMVTKEIIQLCNDSAKIVLVSSDILKSMRNNATPTRAEVSDIANSAVDGADAVILSEDLAQGRHAMRGLHLAKRAIEDIELKTSLNRQNWIKHAPSISDTLSAITFAAYRTAHRNKAKAIVCLTNQGNTAMLLASFRADIPIFAVTESNEVLRRLNLVRGVYSLLLRTPPDIESILPSINDLMVRYTWLKPSDVIVFVSVSLSSVGEKASNLFTVQTLK